MSITDLWRGRGRRRAADRIPILTGERDLWMLLALLQASQLQEHDSVKARNVVLVAELRELTAAHTELAESYLEAEADLRNWRAISSPAPADHGLPIALPNLDDTREMRIPDVWTIDGLRPLEPVTEQAA